MPARNDYVSACRVAAVPPEADDPLWDAAQETLRREGFRPDRVDRRAGLITTLPETSRHFFEFWRRDVITRRDFWEATVNPIRRRVEVSLGTDVGSGERSVSVAVFKQRLSSPDRQFNSTIAAYRYFGDSLPSTTGLARITPENDRWLDMGRDPALEDHLLRKLLQRAGVQGQFAAATP
ncbi:MAG: hypothetical protein HY763_15405 [Planctomycetes bacterium]|nr:hypothetical protein [Planctomycetota bacterium]